MAERSDKMEPNIIYPDIQTMENPPTFLFQRKPSKHEELLRSANPEDRMLGQFLEALSLTSSDHLDPGDRVELLNCLLLLG